MRKSTRLLSLCLLLLPTISADAVPTVGPSDVLSGAYDYDKTGEELLIEGEIIDVFPDDIDSRYAFITFKSGNETFYSPIDLRRKPLATLQALVGAKVRLLAASHPVLPSYRRLVTGRLLVLTTLDNIFILEPPPKDRFDVPPIGDVSALRPQELPLQGRRKLRGRVTAVWDNSSFLMQTVSNKTVRIDLSDQTPPTYGDYVEAVGFPETDVFRLHLNRAIWRKLNGTPWNTPAARDVSARTIVQNTNDRRTVLYEYQGEAIRMVGTVLGLPVSGDRKRKIIINNDNELVTIDASATPSAINGLSLGCTVAVSGTCVMDVENWRPNAAFPRIKGFFIVLRTPNDLQILAFPTWWTAERLLMVIGLLAALVLVSILWGLLLRRTAERRGEELAEERIAHAEANIKTLERIRLAAELHDSLAQNLTGVSMELQSAELCDETRWAEIHEHVHIAELALKSCQNELRNSLWDLRNDALEEDSVNKAIHRTILPHIRGIDMHIRFNVERALFTDSTLHELLRIIRELVINGIRHGHATEILIAGAVELSVLRISVRDNGSGFDPELAPGVTEGHFGIQGIRERLRALHGLLQYESQPCKGTRAIVTIQLPKELRSQEEVK